MNDEDNLTAEELMESYKKERDQLKAELDLIRYDIVRLMREPHVPNPSRVVLVLFPSEDTIRTIVEDRKNKVPEWKLFPSDGEA
jgi:hypothetical protein